MPVCLSAICSVIALQLSELKDKVYPLAMRSRQGEIPNPQGTEYLETKMKLLFNYCINILFYLILRAQQYKHLKHHPVITHLVRLRTLVKKLKPLDKKLSPEIEQLLGHQLQEEKPSATQKDHSNKEKDTKKIAKRKRKAPYSTSKVEETPVEQLDDAFAYYESVRKAKKQRKEASQDASGLAFERMNRTEEHLPDDKRSINYQIAKNKGLQPQRNKEQRNPRVKHRRKYHKALIKRKSQVRPVVDSLEHYGGELSGIRSHLTKSIKIH
jgi:U3 small nucleolar RNA-associated protein 3